MLICQQAVINAVGSSVTNNQYQSGRCNLTAFMGGGPTNTKTTASSPSDPVPSVVVKAPSTSKSIVIACRDIDHNSGSLLLPKSLKPFSPPPPPEDDTVERNDSNGLDETKNTMVNHSINGTKQHFNSINNSEQDRQQEQTDMFIVPSMLHPPLSSIATRAAFHELPPSLYSEHDDDNHKVVQQQTESLTDDDNGHDDDCETFYFLDTLQTLSPFDVSLNLFLTRRSDNDSLSLSRDSTTSSTMVGTDQLDGINGHGAVDNCCCCAKDDDAVSHDAVLSLLYQRCSTEGKAPLNMFESNSHRAIVERIGGGGGGINELGMTPAATHCCASMKDKLSDFRSFGASVAIDML